MFKFLLVGCLLGVLYFLSKRYRHRLSTRVRVGGHVVMALLTLGATLPASLLSREKVSPAWRLGVGWIVAVAALGYAVWLAWQGDGVSARAGSVQASKYLLPALLGPLLLGLQRGRERLASMHLPVDWNQRLERRTLFLFLCGMGIWLMAAMLHAYLNNGFSNPSLAPWVNNAYWLIAIGLLGWAVMVEARQYWMLRQVQRWCQQPCGAFCLDDFVRQAQRRFPGSWQHAVWTFANTWSAHQQALDQVERVQLGQKTWVFDQAHYVTGLLTFLELPMYRTRQRQACQQWLAQTFQLPEAAASALLQRVETNTA